MKVIGLLNFFRITFVMFVYYICLSSCNTTSDSQIQKANPIPNDQKANARIDAGFLIIESDIETVTGFSVKRKIENSTPAGGSRCIYQSIEGPPWKSIEISVESSKAAIEGLEREFKEITKLGGLGIPIPNIGDEAVWVSGKSYVAKTLKVLKKDTCALSISIIGLDEEIALEVSKKLASKAIAKL